MGRVLTLLCGETSLDDELRGITCPFFLLPEVSFTPPRLPLFVLVLFLVLFLLGGGVLSGNGLRGGFVFVGPGENKLFFVGVVPALAA